MGTGSEFIENMQSDGEIALRILQGKTAEDRMGFMVNWLRGTIVIPDEVMLRIWLMENGKRGLKPDMNDEHQSSRDTDK